MAIRYPDALPCFSATNYAYTNQNKVQTTQFSSGRTRQRKRLANAPTYFSLSATMTTEQLSIFDAWLEYELDYINWFDVKLTSGRGLEDWNIRHLNDAEIARTKKLGDRWSVSFNVEAKKARFISKEDYKLKIANQTYSNEIYLTNNLTRRQKSIRKFTP